jgi:hypothetical protein
MPPTALVKMEVDDALRSCPATTSTKWILPKLEDAVGFAPGDFVDDNHLDTVLKLVSETSHREGEGRGVAPGGEGAEEGVLQLRQQRRRVRPPTRRCHDTRLR